MHQPNLLFVQREFTLTRYPSNGRPESSNTCRAIQSSVRYIFSRFRYGTQSTVGESQLNATHVLLLITASRRVAWEGRNRWTILPAHWTPNKKKPSKSHPPPSCTFWHITFRRWQTVFTPTNWSLLVRHTSINDGKQKRKKK